MSDLCQAAFLMQAIDCRLYASDRAVKISTAENSHEAMHPADPFEASAKLLASGLSEQQVASRFGLSVLTVQRRMTLASLAPRFIALFRADKISMDQLQALAHSPDHAVQIAAWDSLSEYQRSPYMLKQALTDDKVESNSRLAKFVGLDVYTDAGGAVRRDLFGEPDECWLQDVPLLRRLAQDRLEAVASVEREAAWSRVVTHCSMDHLTMSRFERQWPKAREATPDQAEVLAFWQGLIGEANAEVRQSLTQQDDVAKGSAEEAALHAQMEALNAVVGNLCEMDELLQESLIGWSPTDLATCGVIVTIDHQGRLDVRRGLMRPEDRKAHVQSLKKAGQPVPASLQGADAAKGERAVHSERLMLDLTAHRTAALQAALTDNTNVALALVVQRLVEPIFCQLKYRTASGPLKVSTTLTRHTAVELCDRLCALAGSHRAGSSRGALEGTSARPGPVCLAAHAGSGHVAGTARLRHGQCPR